MSLFVIGSFFAFITASNATVTPTVIAPAISQQAQDWLGSLNSANQDLKKQHVVRTVSLKVNHQRQESIAKIDTNYQKSKEEFLQTSHTQQSLVQESYIQALTEEYQIQQPQAYVEKLSAGVSRSWKKTEKITDKAIEKIKFNIAGIKLKFDNSQFADDELFPQIIDEQMLGDESFHDPRSYTQKAFDEESKEEIEKSIQDALLEADQELAQDFNNELSFSKRSILRAYRHDPSFMELYLSHMDQSRPGIKRDLKDFLFSKKVFTKEQMQKILNDFNFIKQEMNFDESTVNIDNSEAEMIKQIDDFNKTNEQNIKSLYLNYPEFAELQKKINHQQELISINNDLLDNAKDLIDLLESDKEDELTVRKKRDVFVDNPILNKQSLLTTFQNKSNYLKQEIQNSEIELASLKTESIEKHPSANAAIQSQKEHLIKQYKMKQFAQILTASFVGAVALGLILLACFKVIGVTLFSFLAAVFLIAVVVVGAFLLIDHLIPDSQGSSSD